MKYLPHRYPFLLIDRIVKCTPGEQITAIKNVTMNEPFFQGHFPGNPVMPGVLIIEAMAQAGGVLSHLSDSGLKPRPLYFLAGVDDARFRRPVTAGDQLELVVRKEKVRGGMWRYGCEAFVAGQLAVSARILCAPGK
ncbi:MAG: 3-hydroxyacyl-ACP dehydratase FabZ [Woeseia sp.]|nr:3-hydroxyacyl-ACP dehydratase FabZ [Woeseia sp.]MBT8096142.1 3-hydroxyacyl-ACP dehydratase FabZ [Woeseia sp.]